MRARLATASADLPASDLLPVGRHANVAYRLVRLIAVPLLRLCFRFDVRGRENIPRSGNYVVIANHLNWLDEFTLLYLLPVEPRLHFLADPTILVTRKLQWWLVRITGGYVPVVRERRGDRALFRHVDRCLEAGGAIAIFPEGNYGRGDRPADAIRGSGPGRADRARLREDEGDAPRVFGAAWPEAVEAQADPPVLTVYGVSVRRRTATGSCGSCGKVAPFRFLSASFLRPRS
ncbi:MAG: 1-acyl-sn-glycerol-3-phosphate acyltransferase [Chloroflexi bacterium]|nr:MAG: 1-acyl-sn-glycerol-3-phosphate acyltransferase [Chloroflexota bacterium]